MKIGNNVKPICCIFNLGPSYRQPVYSLMQKELECHFYLGDKMSAGIKLMNYAELPGFRKTLRNIKIFSHFYIQAGAIKLVFKSYRKFILTGDPYCLSNWLILVFALLFRKQVYLWTHGWYGDESWAKKYIKKLFFGLATKVFLYSNYSKNLMTQEGIDEFKLVCIYNSLDYERQVKLRNTLSVGSIYTDRFNNAFPVLLYIGRIQKVKKLDLLLYSLAELKKTNHQCNLIIIGASFEESNLEKLAEDLDIKNNIWFYGPCYEEEEIAKLIYNADVSVTPGNIGLTAIHSLTYGLPVITHDNFAEQGPEFEAIMEGFNGGFYKQGDLEDLTQKIKHWITESSFNREQIRDNCYKIVDEKYTPKNQVEIMKLNINDK